MPEIALPPEVASVVKRPDVRMIIGAALGGLALGLFVGIKLAGPRNWVPEATETPCAECEEREQVSAPPDLTPEQAEQLVATIAEAAGGIVKTGPGPSGRDITIIEVEGLADKVPDEVEDVQA